MSVRIMKESARTYRQDGQWVRRCGECNETLPLRDFRPARKEVRGNAGDWLTHCRYCDPQMPRLRVAPILALVNELILEREGLETESANGAAVPVCRQLGVTDRTLRRWRNGEIKDVSWDTAERVLMNAGRFMWELWTEEELDGSRLEPDSYITPDEADDYPLAA